jgi:non-ribosomal peptide synthetase component F
VFSQTSDHTFDLAMFDLFCAWSAGGTLIHIPTSAYTRLPEFLMSHGVTVWFSAPRVISLARRLRCLTPNSMPSLRWSLFCGESLLRHDVADWQSAAPHSVVENLYGPTELTLSCTVHRWDSATSPALCVNDVAPIGKIHPGLKFMVVDGELCVTGEQMIPGYLDPADDIGRFLDHGGIRWYRTGDLVEALPNGELAYLGRRDHQVKVKGWRVELAEIDWAMRQCSTVQDSVTVMVNDELFVFYLGDPAPIGDLKAELATFLPKVIIPKYIRHLADFPLDANRKVDRRALAAIAEDSL